MEIRAHVWRGKKVFRGKFMVPLLELSCVPADSPKWNGMCADRRELLEGKLNILARIVFLGCFKSCGGNAAPEMTYISYVSPLKK